MPSSAGFCGKCGAQVTASPASDASTGDGELKPGTCPKCREENRPSATFCRHCGAALTASPSRPLSPVEPTAKPQGARGAPAPRSTPGAQTPSGTRRRWQPALAVAAVLLLAGGVGAAVVSLNGNSSGSSDSATSPPVGEYASAGSGSVSSPSTQSPDAPSPSSEATARSAILGVLHDYEADYSEANVGGLARLFSSDVERHGLSGAKGCATVSGQSEVLAAYRSQFENGPIPYELVGLSAGEIEFPSAGTGQVDTRYLISSSYSSGSVSFTLEERGGTWLIGKIDATCHPTH
jgi:hypothetical protein